MRFQRYENFLHDPLYIDRVKEANDRINDAMNIVKSQGYNVHRIDNVSFSFVINGARWEFENTFSNESYLRYPSSNRNHFTTMYSEISSLEEILTKNKKSSAFLLVIDEFLSILGFDSAKLISTEIKKAKLAGKVGRTHLVSSVIEFPEFVNDKLKWCRILAENDDKSYVLYLYGEYMKSSYKGSESFDELKYTDFETDDFLHELMYVLGVNNPIAEQIIEKTHASPLGTCLPELRHAFRGSITAKKFGF